MGENSAIQWTDHTWNPWQGCHKVSAGCQNCYMECEKLRYGQDPTVVKRSAKQTFNLPYRLESGRVFTCSWSDFFIEEADGIWRLDAWDIIRRCPHLTFLILTKRPERIAQCLPADWGNGWPNVWLGVTAENQEMADKRIPILLQIPAAVRFVSVEPMLGPVDLAGAGHGWLFVTDLPDGRRTHLDWVICGGESGPGARPMHPDWARSLRDQCQAAGVPFFFKQWGEYVGGYATEIFDGHPGWLRYQNDTLSPNYDHYWGDGMVSLKVGKHAAGRLLDGQEWNETPWEV